MAMSQEPAVGSKSSWGSELVPTDRGEDQRLNRLAAMDTRGDFILEKRHAERCFRCHRCKLLLAGEDFKKRQAEVFRKMEEAKAHKKVAKATKKGQAKIDKKGKRDKQNKVHKSTKNKDKKKKGKKRKRSESSSNSSESSSNSNSSESSSNSSEDTSSNSGSS